SDEGVGLAVSVPDPASQLQGPARGTTPLFQMATHHQGRSQGGADGCVEGMTLGQDDRSVRQILQSTVATEVLERAATGVPQPRDQNGILGSRTTRVVVAEDTELTQPGGGVVDRARSEERRVGKGCRNTRVAKRAKQ